MDNMLEIHKLDCFNILTAIDYILRNLLSLETAQKDKLAGSSLNERESEEVAKKMCLPLCFWEIYFAWRKGSNDNQLCSIMFL